MLSGMYENAMEQPKVLKGLVDKYLKGTTSLAQGLAQKENLYLVGTGASLNSAFMSVPAFAKFKNIVPTVLPASEIGHYVHLFNKNTGVVLISQSGDSYETKMMCDLMLERGLDFWGITNEAASTLAQKAPHPLLMDAQKEVSSATKTQTATLMLLYIMAASGNKTAENALCKMPDCAAETLKICAPLAESMAENYLKTEVMYLLGDNINGATAKQAALMIKEKNRIYAEGMTASEFRHGAIEVAKKGLQFQYIAPSKENRQETQKHIAYLQSLGCEVSVAAQEIFEGVDEKHFFKISCCGEDVFQQLCSAIPYQLLAEAVARKKGYDPDGFQYLTKVVAAYG